MAIIGFPPYNDRPPIEYSLRCTCARRYLVFTGLGRIVGDAEGRAKERAANMGATFIDARSTPFMNCACGQLLDFALDDLLVVN